MSGSSVRSVYMDAPTDFDDTSTHGSITPTATPTPFASMNPYATYDAIADYEMGSALHRQSITSDVHMPSQSVTPVDVSMTSQSATPMIVSPVIMSTTLPSLLCKIWLPMHRITIPQPLIPPMAQIFPSLMLRTRTLSPTSDLAFLGAMVDTSFTFDPTLNGDFTMPEASSINAEVARYLFNELPGITSEWPAPLAAPKPRYHAQFAGTTKGTVGAVSGVKRKRPTVTVNETDDPVRRKRREPSDTLDVAPASPSAPTPACPSATSAPALPSTPSHTPATPAPTLPSVATSSHLPDPAAEGPLLSHCRRTLQ
ncbi:hypothetical protein IMY05_C4445000300 [Salix suchowensis]|nr:hypothetical protein IMY05_C4445000300 [Salix suchowensis]